MLIKTTAKLAAFIIASGIASAQTPPDDGVSAVTRDRRSNTNQVVSVKAPKVHVGAWFVRLPHDEVVNFRNAFSPDAPNGDKWQATISEIDAKQHLERWKALPGAKIVDGFDAVTMADFSIELTKRLSEKPEATLRPILFLNVLPRIDTNDTRRVHLEFTAAVTNRSDTLPPVERFSGAVTLWDGQRVALPAETGAERPSNSQLVLVLWPEIVYDHGSLAQERK